MSAHYYRLSLALAASLSLSLAACGSDPVVTDSGPPTTAPKKVAVADDPDRTDETIWTVLGIGKRNIDRDVGPQTGATVSPVLWQAALDTLHFAGTSSEDPVTGQVVTNWYSPPNKPNERLRIAVFILSRALRSDSIAVNVEREERSAAGGWQATPVAKDVQTEIETAILLRARQIHAERYRNTTYN